MVSIDTARYCESGSEIDIDELEEEVALGGMTPKEIRDSRCFKCLGCELRLDPRAIDRSVNKVSAYFAPKIKNTDHESTCDLGGYLKFIITKNRKELSKQGNGFPYGYPSKLDLTNGTKGDSGDPPEPGPNGGNTPKKNGDSNININGKHNRTVKTLKLLVKHYMAFPEPEFRRSALIVPGIGASTYEKAFQCLKWRRDYEYKAIRIYYSEILWKNTLISENKIIIRTVEGKWEGNTPPKQSIYLEIDISQYSETQKELTKKWLTQCINAAKSTKKNKAWLFFLGNQVKGDDFKFELFKNDFRTFFVVNDDSFQKGYPSTVAVKIERSSNIEDIVTAQKEEVVLENFPEYSVDSINLDESVEKITVDSEVTNKSDLTTIDLLNSEINQSNEMSLREDNISETSSTDIMSSQTCKNFKDEVKYRTVPLSEVNRHGDKIIKDKSRFESGTTKPLKEVFNSFVTWFRSKFNR